MNCSGLIRAAGVLGLGLGVLAGCGGSGSSTGTASQPVSNPAPNTAPTISGQAATSVTAGQAYSFTPTANDADGDRLTFSISNAPGWAAFDVTTGKLAGTPQAASVGDYPNIVVSVTDGTTSVSLAAFSISVNQAAPAPPTAGTAALSWTPPTTNTDGSPLTNLAGYRIYYGTNANAMTQSVNITSVATTSYVVQNLAAGTWYFAVKAYTNTGTESSLSNVASKSI